MVPIVVPSIAAADGLHAELQIPITMADQNQGKGTTQGGTSSEKGNQGGTHNSGAAITEQGRKDQDRGDAQREDPQAGEPRSKDHGAQGNDQPRQDKTRSGMTGGQTGDTDATEGAEKNDPSRTTAGQELPGAAKGNDMGGKQGSKVAERDSHKIANQEGEHADKASTPNATHAKKGDQGGQR